MHHRIYNFGDQMTLVDRIFFTYKEDKELQMKFSTKFQLRPIFCTLPVVIALGVIGMVCLLM